MGVSNSIQLEEGPLTIPIGMAGEGTQAVLRLIDKLERSSAIVAVEEPETHLHPGLAKKVGRLLFESAAGGKQIFVTTHSPFLMDRTSLHNLFVVGKTEGKTRVSSVGSLDDVRNSQLELGLRPSDVLFSDAVLLVDGLSDEIFFNGLSEIIGAPFAEAYVKVIAAHGKSRGKYKIAFWSELVEEAAIPLYVILDADAQDEADSAISEEQVLADQCLLLKEGSLEDYYPPSVLSEILSSKTEEVSVDSIPVGDRVEWLANSLKQAGESKNSWKPRLAKDVIAIMAREGEQEYTGTSLDEITGFLRKIHRDLGV